MTLGQKGQKGPQNVLKAKKLDLKHVFKTKFGLGQFKIFQQ